MRVPLIVVQVLLISLATSKRFKVRTNRTWKGPGRGQVNRRPDDDKIAGGDYVKSMTEYPYMVSIQIYNSHQCGGVLLTPNFVVTACHCLADLPEEGNGWAEPFEYWKWPAFSFVAGTKNIEEFERNVQIGKAKSLHIHPECQIKRSLIYDHGVAIMRKPFRVTPYVKPVKMYTWNQREFRTLFLKMFQRGNPKCVVAGWGDTRREVVGDGPGESSDRLKFVQMFVLSEKDCSKAWTDMLPWQFRGFNFWNHGVICTVSRHLDESDCAGDSGSPFVCEGHLVATVSYGTEDCAFGAPSVYATIAELLRWIEKDFADNPSSLIPRVRVNSPSKPPTPNPSMHPQISKQAKSEPVFHNASPILIILLVRFIME